VSLRLSKKLKFSRFIYQSYVDARAQLLILATIGSLKTSNFKFLIQNKNEMTFGALL